MRIAELLATNQKSFSFEFFPPKTEAGMERLLQTLAALKDLHPTFVSVTYGAGGSTRALTLQVAEKIQREVGIETMAHLTCVGHSVTEIDAIVTDIRAAGITNIMALRGDPPEGETAFVPHRDGFVHAADLVRHIRTRSDCGPADVSIGVAAYPEGHPEAPDKKSDIEHLKNKLACGADFCVTQLFLDNSYYQTWLARVREAGITAPVIPGIMPVTNISQLQRFSEMCGATIPGPLAAELQEVAADPVEVAIRGVGYARAQCAELLANEAPGIHFYTLNRSSATREIMKSLGIG